MLQSSSPSSASPKLRVTLGNETIHVASIADLITMKRAAARPHDAADIAELEAIARLHES